jgi:putative phosphoribosyl transferase
MTTTKDRIRFQHDREGVSSRSTAALFSDRTHAGEELAHRLRPHAPPESSLVAVSPGGVLVGAEVRRRLGLPLRYVPVTRVHLSGHDEILAGAVSPAGDRVVDDTALSLVAPTAESLDRSVRHAMQVGRRRQREAGTDESDVPVGLQVVLVSDGLDPHVCLHAAARTLRRRGAYHLTLAVPWATDRTLRCAESWADLVVTGVPNNAGPPLAPVYAKLSTVPESSIGVILHSRS